MVNRVPSDGLRSESPLIHRAGAVPLPPEGEGFGTSLEIAFRFYEKIFVKYT